MIEARRSKIKTNEKLLPREVRYYLKACKENNLYRSEEEY